MTDKYSFLKRPKKEEKEDKGSYLPPQIIATSQENIIINDSHINTSLSNTNSTFSSQEILLNDLISSNINPLQDPGMININHVNQETTNSFPALPIQEPSKIPKYSSNNDNLSNLKVLNDQLQDFEIPLGYTFTPHINAINNLINNHEKEQSSSKPIDQLERMESEPYKSKDASKKTSTLTEPISQSIIRDLNQIYFKVKFVLNPFLADNQRLKALIQWDLWGPFLFTLLLASTLCLKSEKSGDMFSFVFVIFWVGCFFVFVNANLLGSTISIFQICSLMGYCLLPFNIVSVILMLTNMYEIIRLVIISFGCIWATYCSIGFMKNTIQDDKRGLVLYPMLLVNLFISGVLLMTR